MQERRAHRSLRKGHGPIPTDHRKPRHRAPTPISRVAVPGLVVSSAGRSSTIRKPSVFTNASAKQLLGSCKINASSPFDPVQNIGTASSFLLTFIRGHVHNEPQPTQQHRTQGHGSSARLAGMNNFSEVSSNVE